MVQNAEKKGILKNDEKRAFTLYLKNGFLIARASNKSSTITIPEKMLGFSKVETAIARIHQMIYNEYPKEIALVPIENSSGDYDYPVAMATDAAHQYLKRVCRQNRIYGF